MSELRPHLFSRDPRTGASTRLGALVEPGVGPDWAGLRPLTELDPARAAAWAEQLATAEVGLGDAVELVLDDTDVVSVRPMVRSGLAAVRLAVAFTDPGDLGLSRSAAVATVDPAGVEELLHAQVSGGGGGPVTAGLGASPGAAVGRAVFSADEALDRFDEGDDVILVRPETNPADEPGMAIAEGILTARGGLASHAAVIARGRGTPAVCGAEAIEIGEDHFRVGDVVVRSGDVISIDGSSGEVFVGAVSVDDDEVPAELDVVLGWADEIRAGVVGVRANADTGDDAKVARDFGAEGIGLCRTEHQFLGERLPLIQAYVLAADETAAATALVELERAQLTDFVALFEAMDGLPVTVRLLDPPLHEFLPHLDDLVVAEATGALDDEGRRLLEAARAWHEFNPMIGTRGVRLGVLRPELVRMQVRAIASAIAARRDAGGHPVVEIMIPLVIGAAEISLVRTWIADELAVLGDAAGEVAVGTMIETPAAALSADEIAEVVDFCSFGTNDLTQMTLGFSRDDVEARLMGRYLELGLLDENPFSEVHPTVLELVAGASRRAATAAGGRPKLGVCGEHGGDPASIRGFVVDAGLDYVSCSPYRVPVARLAAARSVLERADD